MKQLKNVCSVLTNIEVIYFRFIPEEDWPFVFEAFHGNLVAAPSLVLDVVLSLKVLYVIYKRKNRQISHYLLLLTLMLTYLVRNDVLLIGR